MRYGGPVEYAHERKIREWNKPHYRLAHWPIWIWVFFLVPGPLTFRLFAGGVGWPNLAWLLTVLAGTGTAGLCGQLPGVEPHPYILRFNEFPAGKDELPREIQMLKQIVFKASKP